MGVEDHNQIDEFGKPGTSEAKITVPVVVTCIVAATSGLISGYDIGISGGVMTMVSFLEKFFPSILKNAAMAQGGIYCTYNSQALTSFTSSLYLAALVSSLFASRLTSYWGRKNSMVLGGLCFLAGAVFNAAAANISMLFLGRILLGFGVGFASQATPIYLSEIAPAKWRGAFATVFQLFIGIGIVVAASVNYGSTHLTWGWRLSLGLAGVPALIMTIGCLCISDTPSSLVERGLIEDAKEALTKIRGKDADIYGELEFLIKASENAKAIHQEPFRTIFERRFRPHLVMAICIPTFQQLTGITIIAFYAPVIFRSVGFGNNSALLGAIIMGLVNVVSIFVSSATVDRYGRRVLFIQGGIQMFLAQVAVASVLAATVGVMGTRHISKTNGALVITLMGIYTAGFGWSWGAITWLISSEIFPMKIRSTGQSISVAMCMGTIFVLSQTFLAMLCHFKYGAFLFYGGWIAVMTIFIILFLPETKGIPLDSMDQIWKRHWFWRNYV